jgi:hypothetical protein
MKTREKENSTHHMRGEEMAQHTPHHLSDADTSFDLNRIFIGREQQLDLFTIYLTRWQHLLQNEKPSDWYKPVENRLPRWPVNWVSPTPLFRFLTSVDEHIVALVAKLLPR